MNKFLYVLDGNKMKSKDEIHPYLKQRFNFPDYYGHNLDGLYDLLSTFNDEDAVLNIVVIQVGQLLAAQPEYGNQLLQTLLDSASVNYKVKVFVSET